VLFVELIVMGFSLKLSARTKTGLALVAIVVGAVVMQNERMQRFMTLSDTEYVANRIGPGIRLSFLDILAEYPFGAGLGSAWGTSIPYFLREYSQGQIGMETEYGRIALELSPVGLILWLWFVYRALRFPPTPPSPDWAIGMRLSRTYAFITWGTGLIGTGHLTAIPGSALLLMQMGLLLPRPVRRRTLTDPRVDPRGRADPRRPVRNFG